MGYAFLLFTCVACGAPAQANPSLVMSIPAMWDGTEYVADPTAKREPICESCARQLLERFEREELSVPLVVRQPDYFERAYHQGVDEQDLRSSRWPVCRCPGCFEPLVPGWHGMDYAPGFRFGGTIEPTRHRATAALATEHV